MCGNLCWGLVLWCGPFSCFMISLRKREWFPGRRGWGQGVRTPPPPEKSQKYWVSLQYWSGSPEKQQSYQSSIQCWDSICPPAKRHFNGVSLAGRWWPMYSGIWILYPPSTEKEKKSYQIWTLSDKKFCIRAWVYFTLFGCGCPFSVPLPHGVVGWCAVCHSDHLLYLRSIL